MDYFVGMLWIGITVFVGAEMINLLFIKENPVKNIEDENASELYDAVKLFISQPLNNPLTRSQIMEVAKIALPLLGQQERSEVEGDWIKCSDRMPEVGQEVIVFNGLVRSGYYYTEYGDFSDVTEDVFTIGDATHWQPLPASPEDV